MPLVARFGFFIAGFNFVSSDVWFGVLLLFAAFHCYSFPVIALSGFSLLLMSATFHRSRLEAKLNENGNEKCSSLLLLLVWVFGACFHLPFVAFLLLFVARSCF